MGLSGFLRAHDTEKVKFHFGNVLVIFMFGFDPQYFKKIALTDSENRVEGMDWKPLELGCPQTADEKTPSLECSQVGTKARKKGQHVW